MNDPVPTVTDPNEIDGSTCHGSTVYVTDIFDGEHVVRGAMDGQLYIATFTDKRMAASFVSDCQHSACLIRGVRPPTPPEVSGDGGAVSDDEIVELIQLVLVLKEGLPSMDKFYDIGPIAPTYTRVVDALRELQRLRSAAPVREPLPEGFTEFDLRDYCKTPDDWMRVIEAQRELHESEIERLRQPSAQSEADARDAWQPIETAPRDGTRVILGWLGLPSRYGYYLNNAPQWSGWKAPSLEPTLPLDAPHYWQPLPALSTASNAGKAGEK